MNEFLEMIYNNWRFQEENDNYISWGKFGEATEEIENYLNTDIANRLEEALNREAWNIEQNAFIAGFAYACKCLSNGKIEFNK